MAETNKRLRNSLNITEMHDKIKCRHFDDRCKDEYLEDTESSFQTNVFYRVLGIIINQLSFRSVGMFYILDP